MFDETVTEAFVILEEFTSHLTHDGYCFQVFTISIIPDIN